MTTQYQVSSVWNNSLAWTRTSLKVIWVSSLPYYTISSLGASALRKRKLAIETNGKNFPFFLDWQGDGVEQNEAEAIELIKLSAEQVTLPNVGVLRPAACFTPVFALNFTHKNIVWLIK